MATTIEVGMLNWLWESIVADLGAGLAEGTRRARPRTSAAEDDRTTRRFVFAGTLAALSVAVGYRVDHLGFGALGAGAILAAATVRTLRVREDAHTPRG
jgi:hypothetical protein